MYGLYRITTGLDGGAALYYIIYMEEESVDHTKRLSNEERQMKRHDVIEKRAREVLEKATQRMIKEYVDEAIVEDHTILLRLIRDEELVGDFMLYHTEAIKANERYTTGEYELDN